MFVFVYRPDGNFQLIIDTAKIPPQKREVKHFGIYFRELSVLEVDFSKPFCKCCESWRRCGFGSRSVTVTESQLLEGEGRRIRNSFNYIYIIKLSFSTFPCKIFICDSVTVWRIGGRLSGTFCLFRYSAIFQITDGTGCAIEVHANHPCVQEQKKTASTLTSGCGNKFIQNQILNLWKIRIYCNNAYANICFFWDIPN